MKDLLPAMLITTACSAAVLVGVTFRSRALAADQTPTEPLSKTYRITCARDVEFQKIEPLQGVRQSLR